MLTDDIRDEVQAEMQSLLHEDERAPKVMNSKTLRAPISRVNIAPLVAVRPEAPVAEAIAAMIQHRIGCVLVTEGDTLKGIFTERDVLTRVVGKQCPVDTTPVREVMSPDPESLTPDSMVAFAMNHMHVGGYRHVPIADDQGRPIGILSVRDVLAYLADFFPEEVLTLPLRPNATPPLYGG